MAHSGEARWAHAAGLVALSSAQTIQALNQAEETYKDLLEVYNYAGGSDQAMADLLFDASPADASSVALVADLRAAITALHELWQAMNNGVIAQSDRDALLRRMA